MTRVLVTGISGEVGSRLAGRLAKSDEVEAIVGVDVRPLEVAPPKVTFHATGTQGDLSAFLQDIDVVVHLVPPGEPSQFQQVLDACREAGVRRFVLASSAAVYGAWPDNDFPLLETSALRPNPGFSLAAQFAEQERRLESLGGEVDVTILRMATLMGTEPRDRLVWDALTRVDWNSSRPMQFLGVDDAVRAFAFVVENELSGVYNVAADFLSGSHARDLCGVKQSSRFPRSLGVALDSLVWRGRRYPQDFVAMGGYLQHPWVVSSEKLQAAGWKPELSSGEALVAARRPGPWDRLRPGQRRALISGSLFVAPALGAAGVAGLALRYVRSRATR